MPHHVLSCDDYIDSFMFVSFTIMIQPQNDINCEDIIINSLAKFSSKKTHNSNNLVYISLCYWYLDLIKEKSASKIILVRSWKYYATYLEWKKVWKSFSFVCTNDYQELLSAQIKKKYLKRNHIICVSGIQDMLSCLQWYKKFHTKNKTNRNLLPNCRSIFWSAEMLLALEVNNMIKTMISWKYFKWYLESIVIPNTIVHYMNYK